MIKFFRHIRKSLLEQNKMGKYFKYAIGEILLVVIGILIALQINNWNEYRKERIEESVYLRNLRDDIRSQIQLLNVYIDYEEIIISDSNDIIAHYQNNNGFYNMDSIYPKLSALTTRWTFSNANETLRQMINSNQINIIQNTELKESLISFNQQIDLFAENTNINNTNLIDNFSSGKFIEMGAYASYGMSQKMSDKFNDFYPFSVNTVIDKELGTISETIMNIPQNKLELINKVVFRNTIATLQKNGHQGLKQAAEELLNQIEKEIADHD